MAFAKSPTARLSHQSHKSGSLGEVISELYNGSLALQPADLFALLTDQTRPSPCLRGLLLPGFHQKQSPTSDAGYCYRGNWTISTGRTLTDWICS
jgi:hypothetical protein